MQGHDPQRTFRSAVTVSSTLHLLFERKKTFVRVIGPGSRMYAGTTAFSASGHMLWKIRKYPAADWSTLTPDGTLVTTAGTVGLGKLDLLGIGKGGKITWRISPYGLSKGAIMLASVEGSIYTPVIGPPANSLPWSSRYVGTNVVSGKGTIVRRIPAVLYDPALGHDGTVYGVGPLVSDERGPAFLFAYAPDGHLVWQLPWTAPSQTVGPLVGHDGALYLGRGASLMALSPSGQYLWTADKPDEVLALAERADGVVLAAGRSQLDAFDANGHHLWSVPIGPSTDAYRNQWPSLVVDAAGSAFVGSGDGMVRVVSSAGQLLTSLAAGGRHYGSAPPVLIAPNGRLVVDGTDGTLRVFG
jgi:PQQ-like domain